MESAGAHDLEPTVARQREPAGPRRLPQRDAAPRSGPHRASLDAARESSRNGSRKMTKVFKALSDNTRQEILQILDGEQYTVSEIVSCFDLSQPTISRHLSVLKDAELVVDRRRGQNIIYRLNDRTLTASMRQFFGRFRSCQEALR